MDRTPFTKFVTPFSETCPDAQKDVGVAIECAGLNYQVEKRPLWFSTGPKSTAKGKPRKVPGAFATVKIDEAGDEHYIWTVGPKYSPIQCEEVFSVAQNMVDAGFLIHSAGETQKSRRVFMNLKAPTTFSALDGDEHDLYVMLRSSHDGTLTLQGLITPIRIFCQNQMRLISNTAIDRWRFRHLESTGTDVRFEVESMIKLAEHFPTEYVRTAERLAAVDLELAEMQRVLDVVMPNRTEWHTAILANVEHSSTIQDEQRRTGWGLLNATTEYLEWLRDVKTNESRFTAAVDGAGLRTTRNMVKALVR